MSADGQLGLWQRSLCLVETMRGSSLRMDEDTLNALMSGGHENSQLSDFWQISMQQLFEWWGKTADVCFPMGSSSLLRACVECQQWYVAANFFEKSMESKEFLYPSSFNAAITLADPAMFGWQIAFHVLERMHDGRLPGCWSSFFCLIKAEIGNRFCDFCLQ